MKMSWITNKLNNYSWCICQVNQRIACFNLYHYCYTFVILYGSKHPTIIHLCTFENVALRGWHPIPQLHSPCARLTGHCTTHTSLWRFSPCSGCTHHKLSTAPAFCSTLRVICILWRTVSRWSNTVEYISHKEERASCASHTFLQGFYPVQDKTVQYITSQDRKSVV